MTQSFLYFLDGQSPYGSYYNQYPGSSSFYSGSYGGNNYNRPGYGMNYPQSGGYLWNAGQKQIINIFTVFLSSLLGLVIFWIAI